MSSLIGKRLQGGKYKLEKVLGRGGFGLTFRAHQTYLDQVVVIKTLHESFWSAPNLNDLQRQFQDEARRLALCSHPNVVRVSDFFIEDNLPYMVMDYIPGRSLADIVATDGRLSEAVAVGYVQQIGKALQAVHGKGLLHRDVKPQNIMIHELTGEAVLIDFGIARELTQNPAQTHTSIVSEGYAPIEQYMPKAQRSAATDIYGLAATLYTLLSGETPVAAVLRDRTPMQPLHQLRPDVSDSVASAVDYGMQVELKDRPQAVARWVSALATQRNFNRTTRAQPIQTNPQAPPTSQVPTRVVAPGRPANGPFTQVGQEAGAGNKTVALPVPTGYGAPTAVVQPPVKGKGCGCVSTLGILTLAIAGAFAGAGFWIFQQLNNGIETLPDLSLPTIELPAEESDPTEVAEGTPEEDEDKKPEEEGDKEGDETTEDTEDTGDTAVEESPVDSAAQTTTPAGNTQPPVLLSNSGNPANLKPGNTGAIAAIPGFSPGDSEDQITARLGTPTSSGASGRYYTSVYDIPSNRVSLAYVYDQDSTRVRQSEASFPAASDWTIMRTAVRGMLDGRYNSEIETALREVKDGQRDRFDFERRGFSGTIKRNANGYVHVYVQN
ncbi:MAG: serine/threonine-protein kinase [Cyanobacteria bacterium J06598_3]